MMHPGILAIAALLLIACLAMLHGIRAEWRAGDKVQASLGLIGVGVLALIATCLIVGGLA